MRGVVECQHSLVSIRGILKLLEMVEIKMGEPLGNRLLAVRLRIFLQIIPVMERSYCKLPRAAFIGNLCKAV